MKKKQFSASEIVKILKEHQAGVTVARLARQYGVTNATFAQWQLKHGSAGKDVKLTTGKAKATPVLSQDPHKSSKRGEKILEVAIGREVRAFRKQQEITVADLAVSTGLSIGMLSKIENGVTSPSLTTLQTLANALSVPLTSFFRGFEEQREAVYVKAGTGIEAERRGTRAGHQYSLLGHIGANTTGVIVEPYLITLTEASDTFPDFQHDGMEFIFMLKGEVDYRYGDKTYRLKVGDSLCFDADAPHGPQSLIKLPARYLSIISYSPNA